MNNTTGGRKDPFANFNFRVKIDGVSEAGFSEMSGISMDNEPIEYRNGDENTTPRKLPGMTKYGNITLKRGFTPDDELYNWRKLVVDGRTERQSGSITLLNEARQPAIRWNFREAWPTKLEGPSLNGTGNEVAIETLELVVEGVEVEFL
jgi:phage tail-like protein